MAQAPKWSRGMYNRTGMAEFTRVTPTTIPVEPDAILEPSITDSLCQMCIHDDEGIVAIAFCKCCKQLLCHPCHKIHQNIDSGLNEEMKPPDERPVLNKLPQASGKESKVQFGRTQVRDSTLSEMRKIRQPILIKEIEIQTPTDADCASVCAMETLPSGLLIVCDNGNNKIKLFNQDYQPISEVSLTSEPGGIAVLSSSSAIVNLPEEKCFQKVKIRSKCILVLKEKRRTIFKCYKIKRHHDRLVVSVQDDLSSHINITDTDGKVIRCIYNEHKQAKGFLQDIYSLSLSRDGKVIYVISLDLGCVGLSLTGEAVFKYKEPGEASHTGMCTDLNGMLYFACSDTDKVVMVNKKGEKVKDLLVLKNVHPEFISYSDTDSRLFIFSSASRKLLCYMT